MSEEFTPEFMAQQRELAEKVMLPWKSNILNDRMFIEADPMQIGYICEVPHYMIQNEVSEYMVTAANHYPAALDEIEQLRADRDSESRWAKEYLARAERAEADAERLAKALLPIRSIYAVENTAADGAYFDRGVSLSKAEVREMQAALTAHDAAKDGPP
jgi:hypothetical protein